MIHSANHIVLGLLILGLMVFTITDPRNSGDVTGNQKQLTNKEILNQMEDVLKNEYALWYPRCEDTVYGGYFSDLDYQWEIKGRQDKMIVTQARHVWSASHGKEYYADTKTLQNAAEHGYHFLRDVMWDKQDGGFYDLVDRQGKVVQEAGKIVKRAYGNAFAIYGLAAYYKAWGDPAALQLAKDGFLWLEHHSYDSTHGGYFQFMTREGAPYPDGYDATPPKDQNSSIHLLESFTQLYEVWPDPLVRTRLEGMLHLIRDKMVTEQGYLMLFFKRDLTPISFRNASTRERERNYEFDHVSFGHDIETGYLLLEASHALGLQNDTTTLRIAKLMVDHSLRYGWDKDHGGIFDGGYYFAGKTGPEIVRNTKEWWSQLEALNSSLMMSQLFPKDPMHYEQYFGRQWEYIEKYLIDHEHGGWYFDGIDTSPRSVKSPKSSIWKCNYHTSRALINCMNRLRVGSNTLKGQE